MLQVEKDLLVAETAQQVAALRSTELQYYVDHIGGIQTMATLLAGFAFTAFVSIDGGLDVSSLLFRKPSGAFVGSLTNSTIQLTEGVSSFDEVQLFQFVMQVFKVVSVAFTLGEMLYVMTETLIARLLGSRLALRGPDGSIGIATAHLAGCLATSTKHFIKGLQWFLLSVLCHALRGMHIVMSTLVFFIILMYWNMQFSIVRTLSKKFELKDATSTDFKDDLAASRRGRGARRRQASAGGPVHTPRGRRGSLVVIGEVAEEAVHGVYNFFNPLRDLDALFKAVDDTNKALKADERVSTQRAAPTNAARALIMREQRREEQGAARNQASSSAEGADHDGSVAPVHRSTSAVEAERRQRNPWAPLQLFGRSTSTESTAPPTLFGFKLPSFITLGESRRNGHGTIEVDLASAV